jgi:hypothetical protein
MKYVNAMPVSMPNKIHRDAGIPNFFTNNRFNEMLMIELVKTTQKIGRSIFHANND